MCGVLGHLGVNVPDLGRATKFYGPLMPLLGYEPFLTAEDAVAFKPAEGRRGAYLFLYEATDGRAYNCGEVTGLQHLAFIVPTRAAVRAVSTRMRWAPAPRSSTCRGSGPSTRRPISPRSGSIPSASCSKRSATTTENDALDSTAHGEEDAPSPAEGTPSSPSNRPTSAPPRTPGAGPGPSRVWARTRPNSPPRRASPS